MFVDVGAVDVSMPAAISVLEACVEVEAAVEGTVANSDDNSVGTPVPC